MSDPQNAASAGEVTHYHVLLTNDTSQALLSTVEYTVPRLDRAMDLAGAFMRYLEALANAKRDDDVPPYTATVTKDSGLSIIPNEPYLELTFTNPYNEGRDAVASVIPCNGDMVPAADGLESLLAKMLGVNKDDIEVVVMDDDELPGITEVERVSPTIPYQGGRPERFSAN